MPIVVIIRRASRSLMPLKGHCRMGLSRWITATYSAWNMFSRCPTYCPNNLTAMITAYYSDNTVSFPHSVDQAKSAKASSSTEIDTTQQQNWLLRRLCPQFGTPPSTFATRSSPLLSGSSPDNGAYMHDIIALLVIALAVAACLSLPRFLSWRKFQVFHQ